MVAKGRWNPWYRDMISLHLGGPNDVDVQGSARVYKSRDYRECDPSYVFKVVVETAKQGHAHMKGIITAYKSLT